jgi:hypothetical protein
MEKIPFGYSIHPGEILKTEFMEPLGLSSYRLAKELFVSAPRVNDQGWEQTTLHHANKLLQLAGEGKMHRMGFLHIAGIMKKVLEQNVLLPDFNPTPLTRRLR